MPELPEVETVRRVLKTQVLNKEIINVNILYNNIFENISERTKLIGDEFVDILRRGKYLIFQLKNGYLVSHLRMEGKFFYIRSDVEFMNNHIHLIIEFSDHNKLMYQDVRKFGRFHWFKTYEEVDKYMHLGPEANGNINVNDLFKVIKSKKKDIKSILLDQNIIAGLGNIYVDEVLYKSGLNPLIKANFLEYEDIFNIVNNSKQILDKAISLKGTTIRSYTSSLGVIGGYQDYLCVHTKSCCPMGHKVLKTVVGGRGTYYCPICQSKYQNIVVGITGGIACGKSTMTDYLRQMGYYVGDSDLYAKEAYNDPSVLRQLKDNFGDCIVNNIVDTKKLGQIVFNDKDKLKLLNSIIHPYVINRLKNDISSHNVVFLDIPLLFEAKLEYLCDKIICLYVSYDEQIKRIIERDNRTVSEATAIINSQLDLEKKIKSSDYAINTMGSINDTRYLIDNVLKDILENR